MSRERGRAYNETPIRKELTMSCPSASQHVLTSLAEKGVDLAVASYACYASLDYCNQHHINATNEELLSMAENICDSYYTI